MTLVRTTLIAAAGLFLITGCETGRTNKVHSQWQSVSDETTTGKAEMANAAPATGQPPVPGSPTAAGPDGLQPMDDSQARNGPGAEEGRPTPFDEQKKDAFERQ
jgi:hypothetical protein